MEEKIKNILIQLTGIADLQVNFSANDKFGDYSTNVALVNKDLNPQEIADKVNSQNLGFKASVVGRFINFTLNLDTLIDSLKYIDTYKTPTIDETVVIDYSSPNIAKPFGIGHLRSTVIGQALYNLYKYLGYNVVGDNHLGDWGTQFGKLLYMIDREKTKDFSIENLERLYVEFHNLAKDNPTLEVRAREWFKKLEDEDSQARTIWKQCINISLNEFNKIYDLLGVKIDNAYGESFYEQEMKDMIADPDVSKYLEEGTDGAKIVNIDGIKTPLMVLKSDGATTYATRDLATLAFRQKKYNPKKIIYEVGAEQKLHFEQVFKAAKMMGLVGKDVELVHTAHGLYLAPDGKKFSTRKGKTIKLEEVLSEAIDRAKKLGNNSDIVARQVGIGAIKYFDLMHSVASNVIFDWEKIMNMDGNSGPYLQYTYARANSVLTKDGRNDENLAGVNQISDVKLLDEELSLLRKLSQFHEVIITAAKTYSPNVLCNYLYELSSKFNTFYNKCSILNNDDVNVTNFRLAVTSATAKTLKTGLSLLGIETPEKM